MPYAMYRSIILSSLLSFLLSCNTKVSPDSNAPAGLAIAGTWELISGTTIQGNDTVVTDYTKTRKFIKIINQTHFAFTGHDFNKGKDSTAFFTSGAGTYTLADSNYTEHLQFCSDRAWEGNDFTFTITIQNDTLTQKGIEKIEKIGVNRLNIEKYVRTKN
jgi:hypothetical protein